MTTKYDTDFSVQRMSDTIDEDDAALARVGKKGQLKREWGFWSILGFATTNLCAWEISGTLIGVAFLNGGPVAVVYGFLAVVVGLVFVYGSLAEMASICPVAGAQYIWTAQFSPPRVRAFASYLQGWLTVLSWQVAVVALQYLLATQIQGLVILSNPSYNPLRWHCCLIMLGFSAINCLVNTAGKRLLPIMETISGICHVVFFFVVIITMLAVGKKSPSSFVWTNFENSGGWSSNGISFCLGFLGPTFALSGADGCVHMGEEARRATLNIPRAMIGSLSINGIVGFVFIVVSLYSITDVTAALSTPTGFPIIEIFYQATGSIVAATVLESLILFVELFGLFCGLASTSRLTWAFARDRGLPFSTFLAHVNPRMNAPIRAVLVNFVVTCLLSLIVIGSSVALNALTSLGVIALFFSYLLPIAAFLHYRIANGSKVVYGPWRLGRLGIPMNIAGIAFCLLLIVFLPFPIILPVTAENMNYAGPILGGILVICIGDWILRARRVFKGPIVEVTVDGVGVVDQ